MCIRDSYTNNNSGFDDEVWVEALDFSGHVSCQLTFDVAYARYNDTYFDGLEVLVSTGLWVQLYFRLQQIRNGSSDRSGSNRGICSRELEK